jgi:hypothetical protein
MAGNKVVARYRDGHVIKGTTTDFLPTRDTFHIHPEGGGPAVVIKHGDLKAIFFVRDYAGNPAHRPKNEFDTSKPVIGRRIRVVFSDGEVIVGTTQGYQPGRPGFFVVPADPDSNAERCYVLSTATREVVMS